MDEGYNVKKLKSIQEKREELIRLRGDKNRLQNFTRSPNTDSRGRISAENQIDEIDLKIRQIETELGTSQS